MYVTNINRSLKSIKSEIITDFIHLDSKEVVITTNKVSGALNLQTIEKYIKNINNIKANQVEMPRLPQSKSFLKIISIPYLSEDTQTPIMLDVVEKIIKNNHIFNNIALILRLRVIKVSSKSDILIIWFNIWDM